MAAILSSELCPLVNSALHEVVQVPPSVPPAIPAIQFVPDPTGGLVQLLMEVQN